MYPLTGGSLVDIFTFGRFYHLLPGFFLGVRSDPQASSPIVVSILRFYSPTLLLIVTLSSSPVSGFSPEFPLRLSPV